MANAFVKAVNVAGRRGTPSGAGSRGGSGGGTLAGPLGAVLDVAQHLPGHDRAHRTPPARPGTRSPAAGSRRWRAAAWRSSAASSSTNARVSGLRRAATPSWTPPLSTRKTSSATAATVGDAGAPAGAWRTRLDPLIVDDPLGAVDAAAGEVAPGGRSCCGGPSRPCPSCAIHGRPGQQAAIVIALVQAVARPIGRSHRAGPSRLLAVAPQRSRLPRARPGRDQRLRPSPSAAGDLRSHRDPRSFPASVCNAGSLAALIPERAGWRPGTSRLSRRPRRRRPRRRPAPGLALVLPPSGVAALADPATQPVAGVFRRGALAGCRPGRARRPPGPRWALSSR